MCHLCTDNVQLPHAPTDVGGEPAASHEVALQRSALDLWPLIPITFSVLVWIGILYVVFSL
jgi:hypothetical protein